MLVDLSAAERLLIVKALNNEISRRGGSEEIAPLASKIAAGAIYPNITVGVHGGQVQWVLGNPYPIRVCDYDGEFEELPDVDERGHRCRMWLEPADVAA